MRLSYRHTLLKRTCQTTPNLLRPGAIPRTPTEATKAHSKVSLITIIIADWTVIRQWRCLGAWRLGTVSQSKIIILVNGIIAQKTIDSRSRIVSNRTKKHLIPPANQVTLLIYHEALLGHWVPIW